MDTVTGMMRLTVGQWQLEGGISVTALMMGLFATREIMIQSRNLGTGRGKVPSSNKVPFFPKWRDFRGTGVPFTLGPLIGIVMGILPGIGQQTASLLTYNQSRQLSKHPEKFGTGIPEGIVASESANNAVNGGALIALMTLGIPGDMVTAVLLGGLMIHGLQPGPLFFTTHIDIVGAVMVTYFVANIIMFIMLLGLMKVFIKIVNVPYYFLFPTIILTCIVGVYAMNNRIFDIWILIGFGLAGYVLSEFEVDMEPLLLGFILGPLVEKNFRTALIGASGDFSEILTRPVATTFLVLSIVFIIWPLLKAMMKQVGGNKPPKST
jgi:putative tricarboxylic transport membrane protein